MIYYLLGVLFFSALGMYNASRRVDYEYRKYEYAVDVMFAGVLFPYYGCGIVRTFWRITR